MKLTTGPLKVKSAMTIVLLGTLCGLLFERLAWGKMPGIGLLLASALLCAAVIAVRRPTGPAGPLLALSALGLVAWTFVRAAGYLNAIDLVAAAAIFTIALSAMSTERPAWMLRTRDLALGAFEQLFAVFAGGSRAVGAVLAARTGFKLGGAAAYLRGALVAIPVIAGFAVLFASADAIFARGVEAAIPSLDFSPGQVSLDIVQVIIFAWMAIGLLTFAAASRMQSHEEAPEAPAQRRDWSVEINVVLSAVGALFALFVAVQFAYLFGGRAQIDGTGMTYAEYARAGFFQLLAVAALTVVLLWVAMKAVGRGGEGRRGSVFRIASLTIVALTLVILVSALKRLGLYEEAYGFTRMRLLSHVFTYWVGAVLLLLAAQMLSSSRHVLLAGSLISGYLLLTGLNAINPDAWIARGNLGRGDDSAAYISTLSADAVPTVAASPPRPMLEWRAWVCSLMVERPTDWRSLNIGWRRAERAARAVGMHGDWPECVGLGSGAARAGTR